MISYDRLSRYWEQRKARKIKLTCLFWLAIVCADMQAIVLIEKSSWQESLSESCNHIYNLQYLINSVPTTYEQLYGIEKRRLIIILIINC